MMREFKPQPRVLVKFCGITQVADALKAADLGVDAIGLVQYPKSPRAVNQKQAAVVAQALPAFVTPVLLVVNIDAPTLQAWADAVPFDVIQFHGDETPMQCQQLAGLVNKRWIKALRIDTQTQDQQTVCQLIQAHADAGASSLLLDAYNPNAYGGTGERFDWSVIPNTQAPLILAGGLNADNVAEALTHIKTHTPNVNALDLSGGIESGKGIKDATKMAAFMRTVTQWRWQDQATTSL